MTKSSDQGFHDGHVISCFAIRLLNKKKRNKKNPVREKPGRREKKETQWRNRHLKSEKKIQSDSLKSTMIQ